MPASTEQFNTVSSDPFLNMGTSPIWKEAENSLADIKETFGFVPAFINNYTDESLPGAWSITKSLRFGAETALDSKIKGLMCLAIAAQIPCDRIIYFEERATLADGATRDEQLEAILMAALTRHWSTALNGFQLDKTEFRIECDRIMTQIGKMMEASPDSPPTKDFFLRKPTNAEEAYQDIQDTLGWIPKFLQLYPEPGIAGAWSELKGVQLNPYTTLSAKQKNLIGLAIAAQMPCEYSIYFHRKAALITGATEREMNEAVSVSATARHWSTLFHGPQIDMTSFKKDADQMLENMQQNRLQA